MDYYLTLFMNIYHLNDWVCEWLKENKKFDLLKELKKQIKQNDSWGIIRDLCNGAKHFNLEHPSVAEYFSTVREYYPEGCVLTLLIAGQKIAFRDLSNQMVNFWKGYLQNTGLLMLQHDMVEQPTYSSSNKALRGRL